MDGEALAILKQEIRQAIEPALNDSAAISNLDEQVLDKNKFIVSREFCSSKKICFIDGGNALLLKTANFALHLVRVVAVTMHLNKTVGFAKSEFLSLARVIFHGKTLMYQCSNHFLSGIQLELPLSVPAYELNNEISLAGELMRRIAEIELAKYTDLQEGDTIVLDGTLEAKAACEYRALFEMLGKNHEKKLLVMGLCKTSSLLTKHGKSLSTALFVMGPNTIWHYKIGDISQKMHQSKLFYVRLHVNSRHAFRLEISPFAELLDMGKAVGFLAYNSKDLSFPGYPYGLIKADILARINEKEKQTVRARVLASISSKELQASLGSQDAHELLDARHF